jgi:hypothetical protein
LVDVAGGGVWRDDDKADRIGTGVAAGSSGVDEGGFSPLASNWAAFLFFLSMDIGSPGRRCARAPVNISSTSQLEEMRYVRLTLVAKLAVPLEEPLAYLFLATYSVSLHIFSTIY